MDSTLYNFTSILLVSRNHKGDIRACFVAYGNYGKYDWLADADANKLRLDRFPSILSYLKCHGYSSLELKYLRDEMISAEMVSIQRDGGYKGPFHRVVEYSCRGCNCLNKLEEKLSMRLQFEEQKNDDSEKRLQLEKVIKK